MKSLSNVTLQDYRTVLKKLGLHKIRTRGGHEMWARDGSPRAVVFQTHVEPIPLVVMYNNLRTLGITRKDFLALLNSL